MTHCSKLSSIIMESILERLESPISHPDDVKRVTSTINGLVTRSIQFLNVRQSVENEALTPDTISELSEHSKSVQVASQAVTQTILDLARERIQNELSY